MPQLLFKQTKYTPEQLKEASKNNNLTKKHHLSTTEKIPMIPPSRNMYGK